MGVRLVDSAWEREFRDGLTVSNGAWRFACPFVKEKVVERLLGHAAPGAVEVVTRFNLQDFASGVSDVAALRAIVEAGGEVRGLRGLHSKVFLFGDSRAAVTSANLTHAALTRSREFGCVSDEADFVAACAAYLDALWRRSEAAQVTVAQLDEWEGIVRERLAQGGPPNRFAGLPDHGAPDPLPPPPVAPLAPVVPGASEAAWYAESEHAFVKFFGEGDDRAPASAATLDEIRGAGCHWACTYPKTARPRSVRDGDTMYIGRMTHSPNDTLIFGRATGMEHVDERDVASAEEIDKRPWKVDWPHYIRVHHPVFVAGQLSNGVSLSALMDELGANAFGSTQEHLRAGHGNTNPRKALMQQPAVRLSDEGMAWIADRLEAALTLHGRLPETEMATLDWPRSPSADGSLRTWRTSARTEHDAPS